MPIVGYNAPEPDSGSRVLYSPPGSENQSDRKGRESGGVPITVYLEPDGSVPVFTMPTHEPGVSVYYDAETDVELILAIDGKSLTIKVGNDRLELSGREWRGLYSGMMNLGPGREVAP